MKKKCFGCLCVLSLVVCSLLLGQGNRGNESRPLWEFSTQGPVRSTPVLSGQSIFVGSDSGILYAVDTRMGKQKWQFEADSSIASDPFLDGDAVYFSTKKGSLYSIDTETATLNWRFTSKAESLYVGGWDYFVSSPVVAGDLVFFGSGDKRIRALSKKTGEELWLFDAGAIVRSSPAVYKNVLYCGTMEGEMYALDIQSGKQVWKFKTEGNKNFPKGEILFRPLVHNNAVYFGARDAVFYALKAETGELLWKVRENGPWYTKAAAFEGTIFAASSDGHFIQALDASTGDEKWKFFAEDLIFSQPSIHEGIIYFGSHDSYLYAVNAENGRLMCRYKAEDAILSSPVVDENILYFGSDDGLLYAFRCPEFPQIEEAEGYKAVYWDPRMDAKANRFLSNEEQKVLHYLKKKDYVVLNASALVSFMEERIEERTPGVVVLLSVNLPFAIFEPSNNLPALFTRYLEAHNSFVSLQSSAYMVSSRKGEDKIFIPKDLPKILDLDLDVFQHAFFYYDAYISHPTKEGIKWGLPNWWSSGFGVDPGKVGTVLGLDEHGRATAWVKNYGGPEGSGFIRIWGGRNFPEDLSFITNAAEFAFFLKFPNKYSTR